MKFLSQLNLTSSNKDGATELAAFSDSDAARLLCLTGSGGRLLDMCFSDADEILALDINPAQNELLRLKSAALRVLQRKDVLGYLGIVASDNRLNVHHEVEKGWRPRRWCSSIWPIAPHR